MTDIFHTDKSLKGIREICPSDEGIFGKKKRLDEEEGDLKNLNKKVNFYQLFE